MGYTHHDGISLTGSGLAMGATGSEVAIGPSWSADQSSATVGTEAATVINVAVQFNTALGAACAEKVTALVWFTDDAAGDTAASTAIDTVAVGTDGSAIEVVAGKVYICTSEADGDLDLDLTQDAADTLYMQMCDPDGRRFTSDAITWAGP